MQSRPAHFPLRANSRVLALLAGVGAALSCPALQALMVALDAAAAGVMPRLPIGLWGRSDS